MIDYKKISELSIKDMNNKDKGYVFVPYIPISTSTFINTTYGINKMVSNVYYETITGESVEEYFRKKLLEARRIKIEKIRNVINEKSNR